jgi:hypothetical protein
MVAPQISEVRQHDDVDELGVVLHHGVVMAAATFPDGSVPEVTDVVRVAANLFSAGRRPPCGS